MSDLDENIAFIDAYFKNELTDVEKQQFDERCITDHLFAVQVADYVATEEAMRQRILAVKRNEWPVDPGGKKSARVLTFKKVLPYLAAACLVSAFVLYSLFNADSPQKIANDYITSNYGTLSQTMTSSADTMQLGIAAFNDKDYARALQIFQRFSSDHPANGKAKKYTGLVFLITKDYDKALQQFDELSSMEDVYKNDGVFLKAVTLMARDKPADKVLAKQLLEQVIREKAEGDIEASDWLRKW